MATPPPPIPLRAELTGCDTCSTSGLVPGITVHRNAPVLTLCRKLLAAGLDPDQALQVYRAGTLALRIRSIGEGARLTVTERPGGGLRLEPWRADRRDWDADPGRAEASPIRRADTPLCPIAEAAE